MVKQFNRQLYLRICAVLVGVGVFGFGSVSCPPMTDAQFQGQGMNWQMTGFTEGQQGSIKNAMQVVMNRFFSKKVHLNTMAVAKQWMQSGDYFPKTNLPNTNQQKWDLLYAQKLALNTTGVPRLNFIAYNENSKYWAHVKAQDVGGVVTKFGKNAQGQTTVIVEGEFKIHINTFRLGGGGIQSDPDVWAGVIAHEMLHCLGHKHGKDEYGDHLQINAMQQAVRTNGTYKIGAWCPAFG